jgi:hypothetical protein
MWRIINVETSEISRMTDVSIQFRVIGEAEQIRLNKAFTNRGSACAFVRGRFLEYLQASCNNIHVGCRHIWEAEGENKWLAKEESFKVITLFIRYAFDPETPYDKALYSFLRIQKEFRNILPPGLNRYRRDLQKSLDELIEHCAYMHREFTSRGNEQMIDFDKAKRLIPQSA